MKMFFFHIYAPTNHLVGTLLIVKGLFSTIGP